MTPPDSGPEISTERTRTDLVGAGETDLAALLDANRHDEKVHLKLINLDRLPEKIADRLLRLVKSPPLRELLIRRHSFSEAVDRNPYKSSRHRPPWWSAISFQ